MMVQKFVFSIKTSLTPVTMVLTESFVVQTNLHGIVENLYKNLCKATSARFAYVGNFEIKCFSDLYL